MRKAMLATKEKTYEAHFKTHPVGSVIIYETIRKAITHNLNVGDEVWIRVQGTGEIKLKTKFIKIDRTVRPFKLHLKITSICSISTKKLYQKFRVKAGAEHSWLKVR